MLPDQAVVGGPVPGQDLALPALQRELDTAWTVCRVSDSIKFKHGHLHLGRSDTLVPGSEFMQLSGLPVPLVGLDSRGTWRELHMPKSR